MTLRFSLHRVLCLTVLLSGLCTQHGLKEFPRGLPPRGHLFATMCDVTTVTVDYWLVPCREIHEQSVGLASQTMKKIWLRTWLKSDKNPDGVLDMPGDTLGKHQLEELCYDKKVPRPPGVVEDTPWKGYTVGRMKDLPDTVVNQGEPILCNIIPGELELDRPAFEGKRTTNLENRVSELRHLVKNWVVTVVKEIFLKDGKPPR